MLESPSKAKMHSPVAASRSLSAPTFRAERRTALAIRWPLRTKASERTCAGRSASGFVYDSIALFQADPFAMLAYGGTAETATTKLFTGRSLFRSANDDGDQSMGPSSPLILDPHHFPNRATRR